MTLEDMEVLRTRAREAFMAIKAYRLRNNNLYSK